MRLNDEGPQQPLVEPPPSAVEPTSLKGDAGLYTPLVEETTTIPDPQIRNPENGPTDTESVALARLEKIARDDFARIVLDGRYVAQLASKNPGIHDPLQTTAAGSHTFQASDILAEHERLRGEAANSGVRVVLLRSDQYGKRQLLNGEPLYVTLALGDFSGPASVRAWCASRFPELSNDSRDNQCAVRRLRSPT
ncbi:hypothetical protein AB0C29_02855 [Actinoplanes sp. NPDC048791]|uniref:hypothetical protein n=1 Tax=Actinoplanes sp. NPDC048791 TaxID=3154623 RepID=UPI0033EB6E2D